MFTLANLVESVAAKSTKKSLTANVAKFERATKNWLETLDFSDIEENEYSVSEALQAPERSVYALHIPLGYLIDALADCNDQNPVDVSLVRNLFDKPEYGVFTLGNLKQDIEVAYEADNINPETADIIDTSALFIKGGRHRTAFIMTVLEMKGVPLDVAREQLIRVRPSTVEAVAEVAQLQMLANVTRSMGVAEKSLGRLARNDVDTTDLASMVSAAYDTKKASEKTDVYRTIFSKLLREETETLQTVTPNTLAEIASAFVTTARKLVDTKSKRFLSFSKEYKIEVIIKYHKALYAATAAALPEIIELSGYTNVARNAKAIGKELATALNNADII